MPTSDDAMTISLLKGVFICFYFFHSQATDAAFTLYGFDDQERNLTFVKTDFQVLKFKFHDCS